MGEVSEVIDALRQLVSLPSPTPPGDVALVADWVEARAREIGAEVTRQEVESGRDNVLALLRFSPGSRLVFNTHMDVNNPEGHVWSSPPFRPIVKDGRVFGCGSCDAKGSLAAMLVAMRRLAQKPGGLRGELLLTAVTGEEAGGLGSLHLVQQELQGDGAVVGEPTELAIMRAHKGTYIRRLRFHGRAAHSGRPDVGVNALLHGAAFCLAYDRINARLVTRPHPLLGPASATATVFRSGTRQNSVPDTAEVIVDRRLVPGEKRSDADEELTLLLAKLTQEWPGFNADLVEVLVATEPSETEEEALIVERALAAAATVRDEAARPRGFSAGCDMSKLVNVAGIPTVVCGPGSLAQAHTPDEFVEIAQVEQAVAMYESIARRFLGG
jgi:acetylornithine deacetylase/succinyl-diaminopimelate desuccinylase family protein